MTKLLLQVQLLLAALSALLPLAPDHKRGRAAEILDLAAQALSFGEAVSVNFDDLARKLAAVRADVEAMAAVGRAPSAEEFEAAMARIRAASAGLRTAAAASNAG